MTEEYDVFGDLDALCSKNLLASFRSTVCPQASSTNSDDDLSFSDGLVHSLGENRKENTQKTNLKGPRKAGRGKTTKKSNGEKLNMSKMETLLLPALDISSTPKQVEEPQTELATEKRPLTRSMRNAEVYRASQQIAKPSARGKGRKRQTQASPRASEINRTQRMFSRREYAALMAAQSTNIDYVDLVSSPLPRIEGVVNLDSDDEVEPNAAGTLEKGNSLDLSFDEENPEISVKVMWNGNPEIFKLRKYQKFAHMFSKIAEREGAEEKDLVFNINDKILSPNDTPASINYKIFEFINGRIFATKLSCPIEDKVKRRDVNKISLKIQSDQWKRPLQVDLLKTERFKILYIKCAEELNISYERLKLSFDGEPLDFNDTPADLDLEGGEAIDLRVRK